MRYFSMSSCLSLLLLLLLFPDGSAIADNAGPEYDNTLAKDFIMDAPWRVTDAATAIPITIILKDCDDDDIRELHWIRCWDVTGGGSTILWNHNYGDERIGNDSSEENFWTWITTVTEGHPSLPDNTPLTPANLGYAAGDSIDLKVSVYYKDDFFNYTENRYLRVHVGSGPFPWPAGWYGGDTHYHTMYTNNIAEFGAPIPAVEITSQAMGLNWITVTDHSCDLDETGDGSWSYATHQWEYTIQSQTGMITSYRDNTVHGSSWNAIGADVADFDSNRFRIDRGVEINLASIDGNSYNKTLHSLFYNPAYISSPLCGTIGERPVTPNLPDGLAQVSGGGFAYASHPLGDLAMEFGGIDITVNGAVWGTADLDTALSFESFQGLEAFNTRATRYSTDQNNPWADFDAGTLPSDPYPNELLAGIALWDNRLHNGLGNPPRKIFLSGGSDGHGDFNYSAHTSIDNYATDNAMGKVQTVVQVPGAYTPSNLPPTTAIMEAFRAGRSVVTDGPFVEIGLDRDLDGDWLGLADLPIGADGSVTPGDSLPMHIRWFSLPEFGPIVSIRLIAGDGIDTTWIASLNPSTGGEGYGGSDLVDLGDFSFDGPLFFRTECVTSGGAGHRAFTNPVWIDFDAATNVAGTPSPHSAIKILGNRPNPFNPETRIEFQLAIGGPITITVHNVRGEQVRSLIAGETFDEGIHSLPFDGFDDKRRKLPSGSYFYSVEAGSLRKTGKMLLIR